MEDQPVEIVAELVPPPEYVRHLNEVVGLTTRELVLVRRKFVSRSGYEIVHHPLDAIARVKHVEERSWTTLVSGGLLVALVGFVVVMLVVTWDRLEPRTRVPIGAIGLAGVYGLRRVLGARRHRLIFTMRDRTTLRWTSAPGEHEAKKAAVQNVVELARGREILESTRLVRS